jgi:hypothetical protein
MRLNAWITATRALFAIASLSLSGCGPDTIEGVVVTVELDGAGFVHWSVDGKEQERCTHRADDVVSDTVCIDAEFTPSPTVELSATPTSETRFTGWTYRPQSEHKSTNEGCTGTNPNITWMPEPRAGTCVANFEALTP